MVLKPYDSFNLTCYSWKMIPSTTQNSHSRKLTTKFIFTKLVSQMKNNNIYRLHISTLIAESAFANCHACMKRSVYFKTFLPGIFFQMLLSQSICESYFETIHTEISLFILHIQTCNKCIKKK